MKSPPLEYYVFFDADGANIYSLDASSTSRTAAGLLTIVRASYPDAPGPLRCHRFTFAGTETLVAVEDTD